MEQVNTVRTQLVSKIMSFTIIFSPLYFVFYTYELSSIYYILMQTTLEIK